MDVTSTNSTRQMGRIIVAIILLLLGLILFDVFVLLVISYIIMTALSPMVQKLEKLGIPRIVGTFLVVSGILLIGGALLSYILTPIFNQLETLIKSYPYFAQEIISQLQNTIFKESPQIMSYLNGIISSVTREIGTTAIEVVKFSAAMLGNLYKVFMIIVFTFYLEMERERVRDALITIIPVYDKSKLKRVLNIVDHKLGSWLRGELLLMLIIGIASLIGLLVLDIPFALPLALVSGLLEAVPIVGPIVATIPAAIIGLTVSPVKMVAVIILYTIVQQLENNIIVPKVMNETVGIDPLLVIVALMVGGRLGGVFGAILSVPITAVIIIVYREWFIDAKPNS